MARRRNAAIATGQSAPAAAAPVTEVADPRRMVADHYVTSAPNARNALDIFKGEWSSRLPGTLAAYPAGSADLFADDRIAWAATALGGFLGKHVLELGPLEAGHTAMIEKLGAASITAIEANTRAYLKCLIVKEILELQRARFLCGDFVAYLRDNERRYDICIASGVLYHMADPVDLLVSLSRASDRLFLWTHYYDEALIARDPEIARKFSAHPARDFDGYRYTLHRYDYKDARYWDKFCGGIEQQAYWMERDDILAFLRRLGYGDIRINFDHPDHVNGPSFAIAAIREKAG